MIIHGYYKNMELPSLSQGFTRIDVIPFVPEIPENAQAAELLQCYLE
jgi:hypothetical protein